VTTAPWGGLAGAFALGLAVAGSAACSTHAKKEVTKTALDAMPRQERIDTFEATLRALDEKPELVDEVYAAARRHPTTFDRFLVNAVKDLEQPQYADMTAKRLVERPASVEQTLVKTLDHIAPVPQARAAMNRAMISRAEEVTDIITSSPDALSRLLDAALVALETKPQARRSAVLAVRKNRARVLAFVKEDPALAKELGAEVLREAVKDKPVLEKALRAAKVLDDEPPER
jgi:hypothetical protein